MNENLRFLLAITCGIPAVAGVIMFKKIDRRFHALVYLLVLALATELIQEWCVVSKEPQGINNVITNIYTLINPPVTIWFFYRVGVIKTKQGAFIYGLIFLFIYVANAFYVRSIFIVYLVAIMASFIIIVKLCIDGIGMQTFNSDFPWFADGLFLYCAINVLYSAYLIFLFSLRFFGVPADNEINVAIASMYYYINAGCNLLTLWAILCIPKKNYIGSSL